MIIEIALFAGTAGVFYFVGTASGKAELTKLKADLGAELPKIEASVSAAEAKIKADVLEVTAYLKSKL